MDYEIVIGGIILSVAALLYIVSTFLLALSAALLAPSFVSGIAAFCGVVGLFTFIAALRHILNLE